MTHEYKRGRQFTQTKEMEVRLGDSFIDAEVEYSITPFTPAKLTADPYFSSPAEGGDVEILKITHKTKNVETQESENVPLLPILPSEEVERLETILEEGVA